MRITFQSLPKDQINLLQKLNLVFKLGELLDAKVLKVSPERALLEIKGQSLLAEVRTNLKPGDTLKVRVTGELQNQVILKVLDHPQEKTVQADQLLRQLGSQPSPETRSSLTYLLKNGLPVTPETLRALTTDKNIQLHEVLFKIFGEENSKQRSEKPSPESLEKNLVFDKLKNTLNDHKHGSTPKNPTLSSKQEPVPYREAIEAKPNKFKEEPGQENHVKNLERPEARQAGIESHLRKPVTVMGTTTAVKEEKGADMVKNPEQGKNPDMRPIGTLARQVLTEVKLEGKIENFVNNKNLSQQVKTMQIRSPQPEMTMSKQELPKSANIPVATQLTTASRLEQSGLLLNPAKGVNQLVNEIKTLAQNLGLLKADNTRPSDESSLQTLFLTSLGEEQKEGLRELTDKMLGLHLKQSEDGMLLHMEIPLLIHQKPTTALLQLKKDSSHSNREQENKPLSILLQLNTDDLGQLKALILLQNKEIQCQLCAEREETRMLLRKTLPELTTRLHSLELQIGHLSILPLSEEIEKVDPLPGQVDFRV